MTPTVPADLTAPAAPPDPWALAEAALRDPGAGWSLGSFGAIAEFRQDPGEAATVEGPLIRATARGAIRLERRDDMVPLAWETVSPRPHRWSQGLALCLPEAAAGRPRRKVLTELGPDADAIRPADRQAILFDMGLDQPQVEFCVRSADPALIATLRETVGRSLFEAGNPAMPAILAAHPHRIAITPLGRCEVFQKIGGPETGGVSPPGPHTHLLPRLLAAGRTHSANTPIPAGLVPCAMLHPASPVSGPMGEDIPFEPARFAAFQALLAAWGPPVYVETKARVWAALAAGEAPGAFAAPSGRLPRAALRNALRQSARVAEAGPPAPEGLGAWLAAFDAQGAGRETAGEDEVEEHA
ncbi:hypothetical protein [uncultured Albimonas sp.]|uniref:DUF6925 family protein n=1 Tax=uncultured Albimonas sp. TaxID=1331701 RepID=UPI0030EB18D2|tara:strand:+ start:1777 stop:2844 length:1068 start_codon:yes stop_codon:yes gene_type:complete